MPTGEYLVDPSAGIVAIPSHGGGPPATVERFSCAPGPAGWRYTASAHEPSTGAARGRVDVTVDSRWRPVRVELRAGGWWLRGGHAGREVLWVRGGDQAQEHAAEALGFGGASPAFLISTGRALRLDVGASASVALVAVTGDVLATRTVRQRWSLLEVAEHATDLRPLRVEKFEVADLDTGSVAEVHLAGDVVLAAPGVELLTLDGPPTAGSN